MVVGNEAISNEARLRTQLEDFGDPPIELALTVLVNSLELLISPVKLRREENG